MPFTLGQLKKLRDETGLPIHKCRFYLSTYDPQPVTDEAVDWLISTVEIAKRNANLYKHASRNLARHWWMRDYFTRGTNKLVASNDPSVKRWGSVRDSQKSAFARFFDESRRDVADLRNRREGDLDRHRAKARLDRIAWKAACSTARVPAFEDHWLKQLLVDPFAKLRPFMKPRLAHKSLQVRYCFDVDETDTRRSDYAASALVQAEQYWRAARSVDLSVKPVLLYYMTTCLLRSVLVTRVADLIGVYQSHGLRYALSGTDKSLSGIVVSETRTRSGLYHAIDKGLPGERVGGQRDWSLLELMRFVPELIEPLVECRFDPSWVSPLYNFEKLSSRSYSRRGTCHIGPVFSQEYLLRCGITIPDLSGETLVFERELRSAFPDVFWEQCRQLDKSPIEAAGSAELETNLLSYSLVVANRYEQLRTIPLLYDGGLDGRWYITFNSGRRRPNQFAVLIAIFYGLSMLARYRSVEWNDMLKSSDGTAVLIEEVCRVAESKAPILATEWLTGKRVLGSRTEIPR